MLHRLAIGAGLLFQTACSTLPSVIKPEPQPAITEKSPCAGDLSCRKLTIGEVGLVKKIFGRAIDYTNVRIFYHPYSMKRIGTGATSTDGNVYIHAPHIWSDDYTNAPQYLRKYFIHEMTHVWQYQKGQNLITATAELILKRPFNYRANYAYTLDNRPFDAYSHEQQASIIEDYYDAVAGLETIRSNPEKAMPATIIVQCKQIADFKKAIEPALALPAQSYCNQFTVLAPLSLNGR